jgi:hypothetical protein
MIAILNNRDGGDDAVVTSINDSFELNVIE